jgi:hypothetical protein
MELDIITAVWVLQPEMFRRDHRIVWKQYAPTPAAVVSLRAGHHSRSLPKLASSTIAPWKSQFVIEIVDYGTAQNHLILLAKVYGVIIK